MPDNSLLAFSSSRAGNTGFLETALPIIESFLGRKQTNIAFISFASVDNDYEDYTSKVREALQHLPYVITAVTPENARPLIEKTDVIMVGGGNTFKLLHDIYELKLLDTIRDKVNSGAAYIGWSAGSNILGPTIGTTNDMPVIEPKSFNALGLLPFQINPHYFNQKPVGFNGETRDQRLEEFLKLNPGIPIIGLPEGNGLQLKNNKLKFFGNNPGILFHQQENNYFSRNEISCDSDLSYLL
jgi:dipeptidase E